MLVAVASSFVIGSKNVVEGDESPFLSGLLEGLSADDLIKKINDEEFQVEKRNGLGARKKKDKNRPTYTDTFKVN